MKTSFIAVLILWCFGTVTAQGQTSKPSAEFRRHPISGTYTTTWLGNSIVDGTKHVPDAIGAIFVTPNGRLLTNVPWDEAGGEVSEFDSDGRLTGIGGHTHGWGYAGGFCITANSKYVFIAQRVDSENGHLVDPQTWPAKGRFWYGISRRLLSDIRQGAPFTSGKGISGDTLARSFLVVGEVDSQRRADEPASPEPHVSAVAASDDRLFIADPSRSRICVYDVETMAMMTELPNWPRVSAMAIDRAGVLWIAQTAGDGKPAALSNLDQGFHISRLKIELPDGVEPAALAIDSAGKIVLADGGRAARILTYDPQLIAGKPARPSHSFGVDLFAGEGPEVGRIDPGKFSDITGVGVDQDGNLYVSSSKTGAVIEKYDRHEHQMWARYGLVFIDDASIDPLIGDVYSSEEHYRFDWSKTTPGSEWTLFGKTLDGYRFPDDVRVDHEHQPLMRRLNGGHLYAFASDQMASGIYIYRFDSQSTGEVAIPCACITKDSLNSHRFLESGQFIWTDSNGDGRFDVSEVQQPEGAHKDLRDACWGWWVDDAGDIWQTVNGDGPDCGVRRFRLKGFDTHGTPIYRFDAMDITPTPAPFLHGVNGGLERAVYDSGEDVMYLGGYTDSAQSDGVWGAFRIVARYDHWKAGNRKASWMIELPWNVKRQGYPQEMPIGVTIAGDYLFTATTQNCSRISVYRKRDGAYVGDMIPNSNIFTVDQTGWVDIRPFGIQATLRPDGTYCALVEDVSGAKVIIYRWHP